MLSTLWAGPFEVFRSRSFTYLWTAQLISTVGDALTGLTAGILVYRETGLALSVGLMLAATSLPALLFGSLAGVLVDRYDRKKILVLCSLLQGFFVALIPLLVPYSLAWLYILVALASTVRQLYAPAHQSVIPEFASDERLEAANAMMAISSTGATVFGYAAAGLLLSTMEPSLVFYLDALTFIACAGLLLLIQVPLPEAPEAGRTIWRDLVVGVEHIFHSAFLASLLGISYAYALTLGMLNTLFLPFVLSVLGGSEATLGIQEGVMAIGYVVGSLVMAQFAKKVSDRLWLSLCLAGIGVCMALYALTTSIPMAFILIFFAGLLNAPVFIAVMSAVQRLTPSHLRGRVIGTYFLGVDLFMFIGLLLGGLADVVSIRLLVLLAAALTLGIGILCSFVSALRVQQAPQL